MSLPSPRGPSGCRALLIGEIARPLDTSRGGQRAFSHTLTFFLCTSWGHVSRRQCILVRRVNEG